MTSGNRALDPSKMANAFSDSKSTLDANLKKPKGREGPPMKEPSGKTEASLQPPLQKALE